MALDQGYKLLSQLSITGDIKQDIVKVLQKHKTMNKNLEVVQFSKLEINEEWSMEEYIELILE